MKKTEAYLDMFVDKLGDGLLEDLKRIIPKHIEELINQRFKGIRSSLEALDRIEAENKQIGHDLEDMKIAYSKLQEDVAELKINSMKLPKEVEQVVQEGHSNLSDVIEKKMDEIPVKKAKKKSLKFWKRK